MLQKMNPKGLAFHSPWHSAKAITTKSGLKKKKEDANDAYKHAWQIWKNLAEEFARRVQLYS